MLGSPLLLRRTADSQTLQLEVVQLTHHLLQVEMRYMMRAVAWAPAENSKSDTTNI